MCQCHGKWAIEVLQGFDINLYHEAAHFTAYSTLLLSRYLNDKGPLCPLC